ncbi:hypothetical protein ATKI12_1977 [Kitasatospora sp. Ki12]
MPQRAVRKRNPAGSRSVGPPILRGRTESPADLPVGPPVPPVTC